LLTFVPPLLFLMLSGRAPSERRLVVRDIERPKGPQAAAKGQAIMFTFQSLRAILILATSLLVLQSNVAAQSGRKQMPPTPTLAPTPAPKPEFVDTTHFEKVKLIVSVGLDDFIRDLNEQGRLGYRVEKSVSYGDPGGWRKYAAVLRLDPGHVYEYAQDRIPENQFYGHPLNYHARRGYILLETYAVMKCPPVKYGADSGDTSDPDNWPIMKMLNTAKSSAFLFMRRDGISEQTREYRLLTGRVGWGENLQETIQTAIDEAPPGFRPVRLLFSGPGLASFGVSVVLERNFGEVAPAKVKYQVVKETKNLVKEMSQLAAEGAHYVGGGRIDAFKVVLLARGAESVSDYIFLDDNKAAKEFGKLVAAGYSYQGMMAGDLKCESDEMVSQKLVFAREADGPSRRYKILSLPEPKRGKPSSAALAELQRLVGQNFQVRDIFYAYGLHAILEEKPEARVSQAIRKVSLSAVAGEGL
jgi:hypothetical protein